MADQNRGISATMADKLPQLVQSLPPELYDRIFALTSAVSGGCIPITKTLRPPSTLQVDRTTRLQVAQGYYGSTAFHSADRKVLIAWLAAIPPAHHGLLKSITLKIPNPLDVVTSLTDAEIAQHPHMQDGVEELAQKGIHVDDDSHVSYCGFFQTMFRMGVGKDLAMKEIDEFQEDLAEAEHWAAADILGWLTVEVHGLGQYTPSMCWKDEPSPGNGV